MNFDQLYRQIGDSAALSSALLLVAVALWMIVFRLYKKK